MSGQGEPAEAWLRHGSTHEQFAEAMLKCRHPDPTFCIQPGRCWLGGACFRKDDAPAEARLAAIEARLDALERAGRLQSPDAARRDQEDRG